MWWCFQIFKLLISNFMMSASTLQTFCKKKITVLNLKGAPRRIKLWWFIFGLSNVWSNNLINHQILIKCLTNNWMFIKCLMNNWWLVIFALLIKYEGKCWWFINYSPTNLLINNLLIRQIVDHMFHKTSWWRNLMFDQFVDQMFEKCCIIMFSYFQVLF